MLILNFTYPLRCLRVPPVEYHCSRVRFPVGAGNFSLHYRVQNVSGTLQWVPGALSLGVKRPVSEADHSPPSSAEFKNAWSCTSTPPIRLHGVVLS
jgi:hypothetical protein